MPTIDNKIVQMTFDNKQFERGVKESLQSLEALKKGLDLDKSAQSLANLEKTAASFDISGIADGVDKIADKFTFLGKVAQNVYDDIYRAGRNMVMNVVNTITSMPKVGLGKYETKTKAVQTIKAALPEKSLEEIEGVLGRLNHYTDMTSYDFSAMVHTMGQFVSMGVDLERSERAMEGIANAGALAGAEISHVNTAMYNYSQAMSAGAMLTLDWRSIARTAHMDTKEFKEEVINTAIALGRLKKVGDGIGATAKGTIVDFKSFEQTLKERWFDTEVMLSVFETYADTSNPLGEKAYEAAKIAITLQQALEAVKDSISSGWMTTFEHLFGNLEEAGKLFTRISDALIELAESFSGPRNALLEGWHKGIDGVSGYELAIEALSDAWNTLIGPIYAVRGALYEVFGMLTSEDLFWATAQIRELAASFRDFFGIEKKPLEKITESVTGSLRTITYGIGEFTGELKKGIRDNKDVEDGFGPVQHFQEMLLELAGKDAKFAAINLDKYGADGIFGPETQKAVKEFQKAVGLAQTGIVDEATYNAMANALFPQEELEDTEETVTELKPGLQALQKIFQGIFSILKVGLTIVKAIVGVAGVVLKMLAPVGKGLVILAGGIGDVVSLIADLATAFLQSDTFLQIFETVLGPVAGALKIVGGFLTLIGEGLSTIVGLLRQGFSWDNLLDVLMLDPENNQGALMIMEFVDWLKSTFSNIGVFLKPVSDFFGVLGDAFGNFFAKFGRTKDFSKAWKAFKVSLGISKNGFAQVLLKIFQKLEQTIKNIRKWIGDLVSNLKKAKVGEKVWNALLVIFKGLATVVGLVGYGIFALIKAIVDGVGKLWNFVQNSKLLLAVWERMKGLTAPIGKFFGNIWDSIKSFFTPREGESFGAVIGRAIENIRTTISTAWNNVVTWVEGIVENSPFLKGVASGAKSAWSGIIEFFTEGEDQKDIGDHIAGVIESIKESIATAWDSVSEFFSGNKTSKTMEHLYSLGYGKEEAEKASGYSKTLPGIIDKILSGISTAYENIRSWWNDDVVGNPIVSGIVDTAYGVWDAIVEYLLPGKDHKSIIGHISDGFDAVKKGIDTARENIRGWFNTLVNSPFGQTVISAVHGAWDVIYNFFVVKEGDTSIGAYISNRIDEIRKFIDPALTDIKNWWNKDVLGNPIIQGFIGAAHGAWDAIYNFFVVTEGDTSIGAYISNRIDAVRKFIDPALTDIKNWWNKDVLGNPIIQGFIGAARGAWDAVVKFFEPTWFDTDVGTYLSNRINAVRKSVGPALQDITDWWNKDVLGNSIIQGFIGAAAGAWDAIVKFFEPTWFDTDVVTYINNRVARVKAGVQGIWTRIKDWWQGICEKYSLIGTVAGGISNIWDAIVDFFKPTVEDTDVVTYINNRVARIKAGVQGIIARIKTWWEGICEKYPLIGTVAGGISNIWDAVVKFFAPTWYDTDVVTYIKNRVARVKASIQGIWTRIKTWWEGLCAKFPLLGTISNSVTSIWDAIVKFLTPPEGKSFGENLLNQVNAAWEPVEKVFTAVGTKINEVVEAIPLLKYIVTSGQSIWESIRGFFTPEEGQNFFDHLAEEIESIDVQAGIDAIVGYLKTGLLLYFGKEVIEGLGGISGIIQNIAKYFGYVTEGFEKKSLGERIKMAGNGVLQAGLGILALVGAIVWLADAIKNDQNSGYLATASTMIQGLMLEIGVFAAAVGDKSNSITKNGINVNGVLSAALAVVVLVKAIANMSKLVQEYGKNLEFDENGELKDVGNGLSTVGKAYLLIIGLFTVVEGLNVAASHISGGKSGAMSLAGPLAAAYAVKILVESISEMAAVVQSYGGYDLGRLKGRESYNALEQAIQLIGTVYGIIFGSGLIDKILSMKAEVKFADSVGKAISSASGPLAIAYTIKIIVDAMADALTALEQNKVTTERITAFTGYIQGLTAIIGGIVDASSALGTVATGLTSAVGGVGGLAVAANTAAGGGAFLMAGEAVTNLVSSLAKALIITKDVPQEKIDQFVGYIRALIGELSLITTESGLLGIIKLSGAAVFKESISAFDELTGALWRAAYRLKKYSEASVSDTFDSINTDMTKLQTICDTISGTSGYATAAYILERIGAALSLFYGNIGGIRFSDDNPVSAETLTKAFQTIDEALPENSPVFDSFASFAVGGDQYQTITSFALGVTNLGAALSQYGSSIGNLSLRQVQTASEILTTISNLKINPEGGWFTFITGDNSLNTFSKNIGYIGGGLHDFGDALADSKFDKVDIAKALLPLLVIADVGAVLNSGDIGFIGGELSQLGSDLANMKTNLNGFSDTDESIQAAMRIIDWMANKDYYKMSDGVGKLATSIVSFFRTLSEARTEYVNDTDEWQRSDISEAGMGVFQTFIDAITSAGDVLLNPIGTLLDRAVAKIDGFYDSFRQAGANLNIGLANGINNTSAAINAAYELASSILAIVCLFWGIRSPSKEFEWVGRMADEGLAQGLRNYARVSESASQDLANGTLNGFSSTLLDGLSDTPTIRPVLDLSDVQSGMTTLGGMFGGYSVGVRSSGIAGDIGSSRVVGSNYIGKNASDAGLANAVAELREEMGQMRIAISDMKVVTETGALIGQISTGIDQQLGENEFYASRGL